MKKRRFFALFIMALPAFPGWLSAQDCANDSIPPVAVCVDGLVVTLDPQTSSFTLWAADINAGSFDQCSGLDLDLQIGPPDSLQGQEPPDTESIEFTQAGVYIAALWVSDTSGNWNTCWSLVTVNSAWDSEPVSGQVFNDEDTSCSATGGEAGLAGWAVEARLTFNNPAGNLPATYSATTGPDGAYTLYIPTEALQQADEVEIAVLTPLSTGQSCPLSYLYPAADLIGANLALDFPVQLEAGCYAMKVDLTAPFIRRCFSGYYRVYYCNYGAEPAPDAYVEVALDDFLSYTASSIPFSAVNGNTYTFQLGEVGPAECGQFTIHFQVSCDAELGQTHCSEAHIYPDQPCGGSYTGPSIEVSGACDEENQQVVFTITNTGAEAMPEARQYVVVEDVIMYMMAPFSLGSGQSLQVTAPANGATYRLEAEQVAGYPWLSVTAAAVEGCGENAQGGASQGMVTLFSPLEAGPFIAIDCQENIGAYDPNDKQALPRGVGDDHLLRENTPIEYKIRFQNTGTDTAFNVVLLDTLSPWLNAASVRPGASSHDYTFRILEGNTLEFRFDNILLPDSSANQEASNGFVQFTVDQRPDNPHGTRIENSAAIYFDFNEPVITNTVFHTIGEMVVTVNESREPGLLAGLKVYPNPFTDAAVLEFPKEQAGVFYLFAIDGRLVLEQAFRGTNFRLSARQLKPGTYFYQILAQEGGVYRGKMVVSK